MKTPALKDDAFLADVRAAGAGLHVWWLGQSGFLLRWEGHCLLFDPYLSDSLTRKYADSERPHLRMTERVVDPARLNFVDVVTSSHNHSDHLDAGTLLPLIEANAALNVVVPEANRDFVADRLGCAAAGLTGVSDGETVTVGGFELTGIPAAHETVERDAAGRCRFLGYIVRAGPYTLYHSGDTVRYEGMEDLVRPYAVDIALLPINGSIPDPGVVGNLDGPAAAGLAKAIGASVVIPCHYDMFEFNTVRPDAFVSACEAIGQPYCLLPNGGRWSG